MSYQDKARRLVFEYAKPRLEKTDAHVTFTQDDVYVVWSCKTLQNWKALVSTTLPDGMYYEVTYNGEQYEAYIDAYKKFDNVCVKDPEEDVEAVIGQASAAAVDAFLNSPSSGQIRTRPGPKRVSLTEA